VGIAHGTRIEARRKPRPRNWRCIISARASPTTTSNAIVTTVKASVRSSAATHCGESNIVRKFFQPTKLCGRFPKDRLSKWNEFQTL